MNSTFRIGDPVQVDETTEVLILVAIHGEYGWICDGAGRPMTKRLEDLTLAPPAPVAPRRTLAQMRGVFAGLERGQKWQR